MDVARGAANGCTSGCCIAHGMTRAGARSNRHVPEPSSNGRVGYWRNTWISPALRAVPKPIARTKPTNPCHKPPSVWGARSVVAAPGVANPVGAPVSSANSPIGGLRNLGPTMKRLSHVMTVGTRIHLAFEAMFDREPSMIEKVLSYVGRADCTTVDNATVAQAQQCLHSALDSVLPGFVPTEQTVGCGVNIPLLEHWQRWECKCRECRELSWLCCCSG